MIGAILWLFASGGFMQAIPVATMGECHRLRPLMEEQLRSFGHHSAYGLCKDVLP